MLSGLMSQPLVAALAILSCLSVSCAQLVSPSNGTLPVDPNSPQLVLSSKTNGMQTMYDIDPLTPQAGLGNTPSDLQNIKITGNLVLINSTNVNSLEQGQLAYISCDPYMYPGNIGSVQTVQMAASKLESQNCNAQDSCNGGAIILYSMTSTFCTFSQGDFAYTSMYTTTNSSVSKTLISALSAQGPVGAQTTILLDQSSLNNSNGTAQQPTLGQSPTTAVAMIILYSITGIITALFLTIIFTGAIRAHRHPERYGPRNLVGRARQTRAKGIARAMLEALPIVKFGEQDSEGNKNVPSERDVELAQTEDHEATTPAPASGEERNISESEAPKNEEDEEFRDAVKTEEAQGNTRGSGGADPESGLTCSVCTDEFVKGQDVRVLPCNHKFHPECIDPWLLNVSGTCPLCRVDLRPTASPTDELESGQEISPNPYLAENPDAINGQEPWLAADPAASSPEITAANRRSNGLSLYVNHTLNLRRMRNATPEERLDALRRIRTVNRANNTNIEGGDRARTRALRVRVMPAAISRREECLIPEWRRGEQVRREAYSTTQDSVSWNRDDLPPRTMGESTRRRQQNGNSFRKDFSASSSTPRDTSYQHSTHQQHDHADAPKPRSPWQRQKPANNVIASGKRKAGLAVRPQAARRRRMEYGNTKVSHNLQDADFLRRTLDLPTESEYPSLPKGLLDSPKLVLHNDTQGLLKQHSTFSVTAASHFECQLDCTILHKDTITVFGEGVNKKAAEQAAYIHLLAKLHQNGVMKELFGASPIKEIDKETLKEERDAKLDIYNYAARYGHVPQISMKKLTVSPLRVRRRYQKGSSKTAVEVTVELPEQDIKVSGQGQNLVTAEIAAAIKFKKEAERYHAQQGTDSLIIKDFTALNVDNARSFFEFYKISDPAVKIDVDFTTRDEYKSFGGSPMEAVVFINGHAFGEPVLMSTKKKAEDLAYLTAAIKMTEKDPTLLPQFLKALRSGNGEILRPVKPVDMSVDDDCILLMRDTLLKARRLGLTDDQEELQSEVEAQETRKGRFRRTLGRVEAETRSIQLERSYREYLRKPELGELRRKREELPMNQFRAKVLDIVGHNTYSIIIGATGSGKTTQVPQIILEQAIQDHKAAACNIICTQPRRIAATSVARRVADERSEKLQDSVGYHVRFDAKLPQVGGSITYCTTGILLQQLQHSPDEVLDATSHLIIDEVHERDMLIDFLLIILKKIMTRRIRDGKPTPKVVLMSATMDADLFASYFKNTDLEGQVSECPTLSVPGRTFPVKEQHLEHILETLDKAYGSSKLQAMYSDIATRDYFEVEKYYAKENPLKANVSVETNPEGEEEEESIIDWKRARVLSSDGEVVVSNEKDDALVPVGLVATTIAHIARTTTDGAILVFLPGLEEMVKVDDLLRNGNLLGTDFKDESKYKMYMLHSSIATGQNEVFNAVPIGCRKIILGTNIAETSITIPDVQYVVDTGKLREKQYDQLRRITKLQCTWISKSNSKQRAGRAGRVQNGHYYALFSKQRYEALRAIGLPELLRADLQETCLDIKAQAFKTPIREFLAEAIEPPAPSAVNSAVLNLQALDALTDEEKLTPLGRLLASLPVHPALGKMIVLGVIFRCLDPMLLLGAAAEERNLFLSPLGRRAEAAAAKESFVQGSGSDHIAFLNAFREMRQIRDSRGPNALWDHANRNFLHQGAFRSIDSTAKQIEEILVDAKLIPYTSPHTRHNNEYGDPVLNENSSKIHVIKALALAGLHPNLAIAAGGRVLRTRGEKATIIHPSSVNANKGDRDSLQYGTLLSYSTMAKSNDGRSLYLRDTSESTPLMATLFGGRLKAPQRSNRILEVDEWLPFYIKSDDRRAVKTILEFRKALERLLTGAFGDLSSKRFLAEDPVRESFAEGLVEVLGRDIRLGEKTIGKGWGRKPQESS
ncbi:hypothetical protein MMC11_002088, partial [Xylographa trunciseda]|nr:hypothetical protein [Xylographa trunciseda]